MSSNEIYWNCSDINYENDCHCDTSRPNPCLSNWPSPDDSYGSWIWYIIYIHHKLL